MSHSLSLWNYRCHTVFCKDDMVCLVSGTCDLVVKRGWKLVQITGPSHPQRNQGLIVLYISTNPLLLEVPENNIRVLIPFVALPLVGRGRN